MQSVEVNYHVGRTLRLSWKLLPIVPLLLFLLGPYVTFVGKARPMDGWMDGTRQRLDVMYDGKHYFVTADALALWGLQASYDPAARRLMLSPDPEADREIAFNPVYYRDRVIVLMYHHIVESPEKRDGLPVSEFRRQMELLAANRFNVIGMQEFADFMVRGAPVPPNAVLITFDDGYESFYTLAFPVLKELGFPAANFLIVKWIDEPYGIPKLTWDQMREMQAYGMSFYSHSYQSHEYKPVNKSGRLKPALAHRLYLKDKNRRETPDEYRQRVLDDLTAAERRLREELGNRTGILAFPYGAYNEDLLLLSEEAGIELVFSTKEGINKRGQRVVYRVNAGSPDADAEGLMRRMQHALGHVPDIRLKVSFGEAEVVFPTARPFERDGEVWLPLGIMAETFGIRFQMDRENGNVIFF
ncbi:MAG TPA: polysaccharide deacetylase family protein [Paenibacillaceae bacterium]